MKESQQSNNKGIKGEPEVRGQNIEPHFYERVLRTSMLMNPYM